MDAAELDVAFSNSDIVLSLFSPFSPTRTTVKARTSGVLLVAGVGSFFAYRVASNYLGNRFVWECLEARRFDQIPREGRLFQYNYNEEEEEEEANENEGNEGKLAIEDDTGSVRSVVESSIYRLNRVRRLSKQSRGLLGSLNERHRNEGIVSRQSSRSIRSGQSVCSIPFSCASSTKSASLRIVWEGSQPTWDDFDIAGPSQTADNTSASVLCRLGHVASTSSIRREELQSVGDLCSVFNDVMSMTSMTDDNDGLPEDEDYQNDEDGELDAEGIWQKCMTDSRKYMYQSFADPSEMGSEYGDGDRENTEKLNENGVDDETTMLSPMSSEEAMTTSHNSKRSRSMYDSAIGAEISSEEGSTTMETNNRLCALNEGDDLSVIAPSCASLEWCDDIARDNAVGSEEKSETASPLRHANVDWDMDSDMGNVRSISAASTSKPEICLMHAPKLSRDLMVMACEIFQPYSSPFKEIQTLYHKRRLKRVGLLTPSENTIYLFLRSALYHKCTLLKNITWNNLEKRFDAALNECHFMTTWPDYDETTMRNDLKLLHRLASNPESVQICDAHERAYQVMLVLEAKRAYDERLAGLFCDEWFDVDSPADVMKMLTKKRKELCEKILWNLICRISGVEIHVIDATSLSGPTRSINYSSGLSKKAPRLTWLRLGPSSPAPLFFIPDDE